MLFNLKLNPQPEKDGGGSINKKDTHIVEKKFINSRKQ